MEEMESVGGSATSTSLTAAVVAIEFAVDGARPKIDIMFSRL